MLTPPLIARLQALGDQIARELVFAQPESDAGLLPINSFLSDIEESAAAVDTPEWLKRGLQRARGWMDAIFDKTCQFSAEDLTRFSAWAAWWGQAMEAAGRAREVPPFNLPEGDPASAKPAAAPVPASAPSGRPGEEPLVLDLKKDRELLGEFVNESIEHLQNVERGLLALESNPRDGETLNSIFRAFHTFKGSAGFLHLAPLGSLAHHFESMLDLARQNKLEVSRAVIDLILAGADTLKQFVGAISQQLSGERPVAPILIPTAELCARIAAALAAPTSPQLVSITVHLPGGPTESSETVFYEVSNAAVKVDIAKLDGLVDLIGEMIITQSMVMQSVELAALRHETLQRRLGRLARISKELQQNAMSLRMVPIRATFQKMHRLARDAAAKSGKDVRLVTQGEETELDRSLVESVSDPLIHMIRNSVDHGIENAGIRRQRGKPAQGTIHLNAFHQGGSIVVEITDDGGGLDRERIVKKAVEKNLIRAGDHLSQHEVFNLIMEPGFSTAEQVTDLSGRGVGLDVVRRNVEKLRGKIDIESEPGQGTTFRVHLPLTVAIIDGLIVRAGAQRYILPALSVRDTLHPTAGMIKTVQGSREVLEMRGKVRPVLRLAQLLGINNADVDPAQAMAVLIESGHASRCLLVDQVIGKQEVVIKNLGETFRAQPHLAGAAIMGDGRVALILDPHSLAHLEHDGVEFAA